MPVLSGTDALDPERGFGHIVAYPHSSNIKIENGEIRPHLSVMSEISIRAAVLAWETQPPARRLILPGETLFAEAGLKNTTALMAQEVRKLSDIRDLDLVLLNSLKMRQPLNNTYWQTKAVAEYLERNRGSQPVLVETLDYHIERVMWTADAYGIRADFTTAEEVLHARDVTEYDHFLPVIAEGTRKSERRVKLLTTFDRKGKVVNWLMRNKGGRLVDVFINDEGEPEFENTFAKKKLEQLESELAAQGWV